MICKRCGVDLGEIVVCVPCQTKRNAEAYSRVAHTLEMSHYLGGPGPEDCSPTDAATVTKKLEDRGFRSAPLPESFAATRPEPSTRDDRYWTRSIGDKTVYGGWRDDMVAFKAVRGVWWHVITRDAGRFARGSELGECMRLPSLHDSNFWPTLDNHASLMEFHPLTRRASERHLRGLPPDDYGIDYCEPRNAPTFPKFYEAYTLEHPLPPNPTPEQVQAHRRLAGLLQFRAELIREGKDARYMEGLDHVEQAEYDRSWFNMPKGAIKGSAVWIAKLREREWAFGMEPGCLGNGEPEWDDDE